MTDAELVSLLRSSLPPASDTRNADLWPRLLARAAAPPAWSWLDAGLAAAVVAGILTALAIRPDWILMLAYHL